MEMNTKSIKNIFLNSRWINNFILKIFSYSFNLYNKKNPDLIYYSIDNIRTKNKNELINKIKKIGPNSFFYGRYLEIKNPENLVLGENVHIDNNSFISALGGVCIGDNTYISANFVLNTEIKEYNGTLLPFDNFGEAEPVKIGKNVWIGMNVCITPGTVIGDGAIIGMGTTVSGYVPPLSIIGSEKWRIIGQRNEEKYNRLEKLGRYGGPNGLLYVNNEKKLNKLGDRKSGRRSIIEVIEYNGILAVRKKFLDTVEGNNVFNSEIKAIEIFKEYNWFPKVFHVEKNIITYEYIDNSKRLDQIINSLGIEEKQYVLKEILKVVLDMYLKNIAHCDLHGKNIFYENSKEIKIIDFETSQTIIENTEFLNTYDITGKGLESPALTGNMGILSDNKYSIKSLFEIESEKTIIEVVDSILKNKLFDISSTFFTRRYSNKDRHTLRNRLIYNTFDLPLLKVSEDVGQRNIKKRLKAFKIEKKNIEGKNILDIGSNIGGILLEIQKLGPNKMIGLEYDSEKVQIAQAIAKMHNLKNIQFEQMDVESKFFYDNFNDQFDIVFCLAVIEHLKDKENFIKKLYQLCSGTLFLEGNSGTDSEELINLLEKYGFINVNYIGLSNDEKNSANNNRPLFIASVK
jgi:acetyltransferase-like isoleucine patch superfamily enzyme/SAM-dependent methyltransferase/predicted Ser/Thr protein kinase